MRVTSSHALGTVSSVWSSLLGSCCKTKVPIIRSFQVSCMCEVEVDLRKSGAYSRISPRKFVGMAFITSSRTNFSLRVFGLWVIWDSAGWIQWFGWFTWVVRWVQKFGKIHKRSFPFDMHKGPHFKGSIGDHRFPEPFSWFLHETGLESLKITSARCFLLKCQRKVSRKAKEHRQFRGVLGRWRTAAIDRTTFHACQRCRKTAVFAVFSRLWGIIWRGRAFRDQQCQFLTRNKSLSIVNESNRSMTSDMSACVPIRFCPEAPV